jgi:hypothetical protein
LDRYDLQVSESLGRLEAGVTGINARLDRLNGSVARHEQRITTIEISGAAHAAGQRAAVETSDKWMDRLKPIGGLILAFVAGLILSHAPELLKLLGK